ncbi:MAG: ABC transporter substrate-binding protein, partial [Desulfobacca sp.]|uniref:ABC transporter substrate-binding protein n=1 Tax=Desulfobacca sp. TaxID=2067990 RepID=UPI00404A8102
LLLWPAAPGLALGSATDSRPLFTFTDEAGKQVAVRVPVRRLVTTNGMVAEIICALGGADTIIGVTDHTLQYQTALLVDLKDKANIGSASSPSIEKIVELAPELVIAFYPWMAPPDLESKLSPLGIAVARLNCFRAVRIFQEIEIIGKLLGKEQEAANYRASLQECLALTTARVQGKVKPVRVYSEGFAENSTSSDKAPDRELFAMAGMVNIAAALPVPFPKVTPEWVVAANPAVIIKSIVASAGGMGYGFGNRAAIQQLYAALVRRPAWEQIDAVKNGRVHLLASEINSGPRLGIGLLYKAKWCHPERFQDVDPEQIHRQWLRRWHNQELRGIYVYP